MSHYPKKLQCKHIPDLPILQHLMDSPGWCNWFPVDVWPDGNPRSVVHAMPPGTPEKLVLAKMRTLIKRGLVSGCYCGCRGDFELTGEGEGELVYLLEMEKWS